MRGYGIICRNLLVAVMVLAAAAAWAGEPPEKPAPGDKCPVCGMFVAKYPDFIARIVFQDGSYAFFDGVKDMMKYYFDLATYNPAKKAADIASLAVTDYYSLKSTDGKQAYYVVGSDVYGPMGRELIPFKEEKAAKEFLKDHNGKNIIQFQDIKPELIKSLD
jgi:copper chaperone NosL